MSKQNAPRKAQQEHIFTRFQKTQTHVCSKYIILQIMN